MQAASVGFDCNYKQGLRDCLNIIGVAQAHVVWKNRLGNHVQGVSLEPLSATLLGQEGVCHLESHINGAAFSAFHEMDEFWKLRAAHQKFHQLASVVIEKLKGGDHKGAEVLFENEYSLAFHDIIGSLSVINRQLLA